MSTALAPVLAALVILASALWVLADAKPCAEEGHAVGLRVGAFVVDRPAAWFVGCVLVWIVFFPVYVASRSS